MPRYYFAQTLNLPLEESITRLIESLSEEGFGLLTDINVQATIDQKLGIAIAPYRILGFCNPHFAYQALVLDRHIGTMLPCSVVVQAQGEDQTQVSAINPAQALQVVEDEALFELAQDVTRCLQRGLRRLSEQPIEATAHG